jgi:3-deoxy-D-manno-octulosonic-acid transferase
MHDFPDVAAWLLEAGAAIQAANEGELLTACDRLLSNPGEARKMGDRGREVVREHQGATERVVQDIVKLLDEG